MRSEAALMTLPAWLAATALGISGPSLPQSSLPMLISICSGGEIRMIVQPNAPAQDEGDKCAKACHATCERKRVAPDQGADDDELV